MGKLDIIIFIVYGIIIIGIGNWLARSKEKGGWSVNAEIGIPTANEKITQYGVSYDLPENAHVTIE